MRTAISRRRVTARESITPETLAHATSRTSADDHEQQDHESGDHAAIAGERGRGDHAQVPVLHVARVFAAEIASDRLELGVGGFERDVRLQASAHHQPSAAALLEDRRRTGRRRRACAHRPGHVERHPQIGDRHTRALEAFGRDADRRVGDIVDAQGPADHRGIGIESPRPEAMAQDRDGRGARLLAVDGAEQPAGRRRHAEHGEVVRADGL